MDDFTDRTVLVTGAAGGIGSTIAEAFRRLGADLVLVDARRPADTESGDRWVVGDLRDPDVAHRAVETAGRLDVLVNAAGVQLRKAAIAVLEDEWQRLLAINLSATYALIRAAAPALIRSRGSIINIGSLSGTRVLQNIVPYGATKAALAQLSAGLAVELGADGVRVNTVAPGHIRTPMTADKLAQPSASADLVARIPLGRIGEPEEIADVVTFLASDRARYVTGVTLPVDGGAGSI